MRGNVFGKMISMTSFGESHGKAMGVVIDGVPAGLKISLDDLKCELDRRRPGKLKGTSDRVEKDDPIILSGIMDGVTLGTPIGVIVENSGQRSGDYEKLKNQHRPGHADKTYILKYGIRDPYGGGRSSGRETLARVIGGYFASLIIPEVKIRAYVGQLGPFSFNRSDFDLDMDMGPYSFPDPSKWDNIKEYLISLKESGESIGAKVDIIIDNCPKGLGEPAFDKLKADLSKAMLSIGGCVSFSYGLGEEFAFKSGNEVSHDSSNFGGIEGGISNGDRIVLRTVFKPVSTIGEKAKSGRHDPCIVPRVIPVIEAMAKFTIADHQLRQRAYCR